MATVTKTITNAWTLLTAVPAFIQNRTEYPIYYVVGTTLPTLTDLKLAHRLEPGDNINNAMPDNVYAKIDNSSATSISIPVTEF
ncbi:MAG: hypothetical protein M0P91_05190 [Sulfuricurvum sp.]|jgi:hypothetical protein|uniref:hypothetical protein n=1 Tax=Sulfuricurvum sp. TaxID=2025608 RepID=UPI0025D277EA|nr:hypothetical protein [Sulfuricurvum sp.]MCK9372570.1 hypothetical protein [Sulfuricurvum sp.]